MKMKAAGTMMDFLNTIVTCTIRFYAGGSWLTTQVCNFYVDVNTPIPVSWLQKYRSLFARLLLPGFRVVN